MRRIQAVPAVLLVAAAFAGCGSGGGSGTTQDAPAAGSATTQTTQAQTATQTRTTATKPKASANGAAAADAAGARVFASAGCGSCHTLRAASASGNAGPNLDDLQPSFDAVKTQVTNGGGGMPSFGGQLSGAQITALARFVADRAGS
jgi:mono/diheme cytochrome c family protein